MATRAGVSIKTVSRVANEEPSVRTTTRARVQAAIDELGYEANPYARYLSLLRSSSDSVAATQRTRVSADKGEPA